MIHGVSLLYRVRSLSKVSHKEVGKRNEGYLEAYFQLMTINGSVHIFNAARELKILHVFAKGPKTSLEIATELDLNHGILRLLLDGLVELKLLEKSNDLYWASPTLLLLKGSYENLGTSYWEHLPEFVRTGVPLVQMNEKTVAEKEYVGQVESLEWMMSATAFEAIDLLEIGRRRKGLKILDIGAGSGIWSLTMLIKDSGAKATLLDFGEVLKVAKIKAREKNVQNRTSWIEGDFFETPISETYDLVIVGNVLHIQSYDKNIELFKKIRSLLSPNGEILIFDLIPRRDGNNLMRILYELGLRIRTKSGKVYKRHEIKNMLTVAGYSRFDFYDLDATPKLIGLCIAK